MKNPLVIGYKGEIGSFILNGLLRVMPKALDIWCVDVNETEDEVVERIKRADYVFLCISIEHTAEWIDKYKDLLKEKIIIEQCSLKEWIYERFDGLDIRSMHILFRPSKTPFLEDRRLALFDNQFDNETVEILKRLTESKLIWYKDAHEHDKEMAIQQALVHRTLLTLGRILKESKGSTFVGQKVIELSDRIEQGDKRLYGFIQSNRYLPEQLENLIKELERFNG